LTSEESSLLSLPPVRRALSTKRSKERAYGKQKQKNSRFFLCVSFQFVFISFRSFCFVGSVHLVVVVVFPSREGHTVSCFLPSFPPSFRSFSLVCVCVCGFRFLFIQPTTVVSISICKFYSKRRKDR
jgi:hypothetical protein